MSALEELYKKLGLHTGSWRPFGIPTPDFGVTEAYAQELSGGQTRDLSDAFNTPPSDEIGGGGGGGGGGTAGGNGDLDSNGNPIYTSGGTGGGLPSGQVAGSNDQSIADAIYAANLRRVQDLFSSGKRQAANLRANAQSRFNDILAAVDAFKKRAEVLKTNAGQEIINQSSNLLNTNARNARDLVGKSTGQARSLGLGLSSRMNLGQGLLRDLASTQGNTMAKTGEQNRANDALFQERVDTGENTLREGQTYRDEALRNADELENQNLESYGTNLDLAGSNFSSLLNNIVNYERQLRTLNAPEASSISAYTPDMAGIQNTIGNVLNTLPSSGTRGTGEMAANLATPTSLVELLKRQGLYRGTNSA